MARIKARPSIIPSWATVRASYDMKEKAEMDLIEREFGFGIFMGRIVVNWCDGCGKWRMHYVPLSKKKSINGFEPSDETFPCTKCNIPLPLLMDADHTILKNV